MPLASTTSRTRRGMGLDCIEEALRDGSLDEGEKPSRSTSERKVGFPGDESTTRLQRELGL